VEKRLKIADIQVGQRHRKDFGDLQGLAYSIKTLGLLQAIGVTKDGHELIFGERRLRAVKLNGDTEIDCRVLDIKDILQAERAENDLRLGLTRSEKHALAEALREEAGKNGSTRGGGQQGNQNARKKSQNERLPPEAARFEKRRKRGKGTNTVAAKAGFESEAELRRMDTVMEKGAPELIEAVDKGEIKVSTAARLATDKTKEEQVAVLEANRKADGTVKSKAYTEPRRPQAVLFGERMNEVIMRVRGVKEQFGGARQMFDSPLWAASTKAEKERCARTTIMASEELAALASEMKKLVR
jgi:ParB-like chromosome segregation protein Spo0J